jgi:hypothetical protein
LHRMRHGFEDEYNSEDYLAVLEQVSPQFLCHEWRLTLHRFSTCTTPINDTSLAEIRKRNPNSHCKNGECVID